MRGSTPLDEATLRDELSVFGLSDTEIDTYLALLTHGEATTRTVAEDADVTQRAVYGIAERLENRGLVRVKDHASPTAIRALPPAEAMDNLSDRLESLTPSLEDRFNDATSTAPEIRIVKSRETVLKRLRTALSEAEHEAFVTVPMDIYPKIEQELRAAVDRDVLVFLLLGQMHESEVENPASQFEGVADVVSCWDARLPFMYAVDNDSATIGDVDFFTGPHGDKKAVAVSEQHLSGTVNAMYLSAYWPASTELYVADPDPLPNSFDWFRQAVVQGYLHHRDGTQLWADIETDCGTEISGRVSQIRQAFVGDSTNQYTLEASIYLETEDGEVSFGGPGAFIEDYQTETVDLRVAE